MKACQGKEACMRSHEIHTHAIHILLSAPTLDPCDNVTLHPRDTSRCVSTDLLAYIKDARTTSLPCNSHRLHAIAWSLDRCIEYDWQHLCRPPACGSSCTHCSLPQSDRHKKAFTTKLVESHFKSTTTSTCCEGRWGSSLLKGATRSDEPTEHSDAGRETCMKQNIQRSWLRTMLPRRSTS